MPPIRFWLSLAALLAAVAYSGRELSAVSRLESGLAPAARGAATAPKTAEPRGVPTVLDANSGPGKLVRGTGGETKPRPGGGVLTDSDGRRLEIIPAERPAAVPTAAPARPVETTAKAAREDLAERKRHAQFLLFASAATAFALVLWARRFRA